MSLFTPKTSTNPATYKNNGLLIQFDDENGELVFKNEDNTENTIYLAEKYDIFDDLCWDNTELMGAPGRETIWINTDYVPLNNGWFMKQDDWEYEVKDRGLKTPVLALIERTYEDR